MADIDCCDMISLDVVNWKDLAGVSIIEVPDLIYDRYFFTVQNEHNNDNTV